MKHLSKFCLIILLTISYNFLSGQIVISEVSGDGSVELTNLGDSEVNVGSYWLCNRPAYVQISNMDISCGDVNLAAGESIVVKDDGFNFSGSGDEMGLYLNSRFGAEESLLDYLIWGNRNGSTRESLAASKGIWTSGDRAEEFDTDQSLLYDGEGDSGQDFMVGSPILCNTGSCDVDGGMISLAAGATSTAICVDGVADPLEVIFTEESTGPNMGYVITDTDNNILGLPMSGPFDLDGAGVGTCLIWAISYEDGFAGAAVGNNVSDLTGCYDLSNSITVYREAADGGMVSLASGGTTYTGTAGDIVIDVKHENASPNLSYWYIITDANDNILAFANSAETSTLDLSGAPAGECHIWGWSYRGLGDPIAGDPITSLTDDDCEAISTNFITVIREEAGCNVDGGTIELANGGTSTAICVDGIGDPLEVNFTEASSGPNMGYVITDTDNNILGLPMSGPFDLDGAGVGTCLIWAISYEDGFAGAAVGNNVSDLTGCYDLSNPITVYREAADGGTVSLANGETTYTGTAGSIVVDVRHENASPNLSYWYIITDANDNILAFANSAETSTLDLSGAPAGECHIWGWSYRGLGDPIAGDPITSLTDDDCEAISTNFITVIREEAGCNVSGGELTGGPFTFTVGDGVADNIPADAIVLANNSGENSQYVVTDDEGYILGLPPTPEAVNFDGAGAGTCLVWHLSYDGEISGAAMGMNANNIEGCFSLSNPIQVNRVNADGCQANGGELIGGPFTFTVGDGIADNIPAGAIVLANSQGENSQYVVTDDEGYILGLPPTPEAVNFDGAGAGTCLVWHLSYDGEISGAAMGMNANNIEGCFSLSNPIQVNRVNADGCQANGGELIGGPFTFTVGDGIADNIPAGAIVLANSQGENSQYVVTDDEGYILGLPPTPEAVNFDGAGAGTCLVWHLSYDGEISGAAMGMNANDIEGCFSLSNPIQVNRVNADGCQANGGELIGGPFTFTVGDGVADNIPAGAIVLANSQGENSQYVVTDDEGYILGLPPTPEAVNFDGAGAGTCLVWHLSYDGEISGAAMGMNANNIEGCFSLSNPIQVNRVNADGCQANGGELIGGPFTFTVGDGEADNIPAGALTLINSQGENSQYVVTDDEGYILGLPPTPEAVNFDGAGAGTCLVWHLSYDGEISGAAMGMNANDIEGCFSLSNPIQVNRVNADGCQANGGTIVGGPFTFTVGDGEADNIPAGALTLINSQGENSQYVVTDDEGYILGLPPTPEAVNFDGAGAGTCLVWHLSYDGEISGLGMGKNAGEIEGCFSLSNPIEVNRVNADECQANGGKLFGGPFRFIVGDGEADHIPAGAIIKTNYQGQNSQYVITDADGNILGLPPTPEAVNFDGAGPGTCLVWHLSYDGEISGATVGSNANEIEGCFSLSNPISVERIDGSVSCIVPTDLRVTNSGRRYRLRWDRVNDAIGYELEITVSGVNQPFIVPVRRSTATIFAPANKTISVRVRTVCSRTDSSEFSESVSFTTKQTAGNRSANPIVGGKAYGDIIVGGSEMTIAPNPASEFINVGFETEERASQFEVFNATGQRVMLISLDRGVTSQRLNISDLPGGVYQVTITVEGEIIDQQRFVKVR